MDPSLQRGVRNENGKCMSWTLAGFWLRKHPLLHSIHEAFKLLCVIENTL